MNTRSIIALSRTLIAAVVAAGLAFPAFAAAPPACEVCGAAIGPDPVVVTDWETNREYRYHDLSCAVREMQTRFPWSRAVAMSPASGQRITLTRINGAWRAQPEEAVAVRLTAQGGGCENVVAFASADEFKAYRGKRAGVPTNAAGLPLNSLPAALLAAGAAAAQVTAQPAPSAGEVTAPAQTATATAAPERPQPSAPAAPSFKDIPPDHWAAKFVEKAQAQGLMEGFPDGAFRGDEPITRYQMAAILARLADREAAVATAQVSATAPAISAAAASGAEAEPAPLAAQARSGVAAARAAKPTDHGPGPESRAKPSLTGMTGLLSAPDAHIRAAGTGAAVAGGADGEFLGAAAVGIGDGTEVAATSGRIGGENRLYVSAKKRLENLSRPGIEVAAGVTGVGSATSAFAVATKELRLGTQPAEVTVGLGSGGVLQGPFAGIDLPVSDRLSVFAESADAGDGRHFNYGLNLALRPHLDVKAGQVDDKFAAGLMVGGAF